MNYLHGFANHFESEALAGALPKAQNSPQHAPLGLYAEQINGSAFTSPRHQNLKTWMYKIKPSVIQGKFQEVGHGTWLSDTHKGKVIKTPEALRFHPYPEATPAKKINFIDSFYTYAINGAPELRTGAAIHLFAFNQSMMNEFFYNADAEMMIVPESGSFLVHTELGTLVVEPHFIAVIPRGIKFRVELDSNQTHARGYVCENFGAPFQLPELGPIGANGLANARDFEIPVARFEEVNASSASSPLLLFARYQGSLWRAELGESPLNTVAWHGNYVPYRYDLRKFNTIGTVSFDHPDPSIFTVLTSPSAITGTANLDFVIFPPRWMVAEHTFRPPYYHRNSMNEFMGLITGHYDAKATGFRPGGASIHNCMTGHGPDTEGFLKASAQELKPDRYQNTMAIMFESQYAFFPTEQVMKNEKLLEANYTECWQALPKLFKSS